MKSLLKSVLSAGLAASLALSASAVSADGFYIGAGVYKSDMDSNAFSDSDTVPAAFVGYQFIDTNFFMLSAELGYYDLGDYSKNVNSVDASAFTLAGVAYLPLGPIFEVYAKAGAAVVSGDVKFANHVKDDIDGTDFFGGVGAAFDILDTVDIYAEYLVFNTEVDSDMLGVGVRLDF